MARPCGSRSKRDPTEPSAAVTRTTPRGRTGPCSSRHHRQHRPGFPLINKSFNLSYSGHDCSGTLMLKNTASDLHRSASSPRSARSDESLRLLDGLGDQIRAVLGRALSSATSSAGSLQWLRARDQLSQSPLYSKGSVFGLSQVRARRSVAGSRVRSRNTWRWLCAERMSHTRSQARGRPR